MRRPWPPKESSSASCRTIIPTRHWQVPFGGCIINFRPRRRRSSFRVVRGRVFDVVVDIRKGSPSFAKWLGLELSAERWNQILVPAGFAHGFVTLEPETEVLYKVTEHYSAEHERSIRFDDPAIGIGWPVAADRLQLSAKDRNAALLNESNLFEFTA